MSVSIFKANKWNISIFLSLFLFYYLSLCLSCTRRQGSLNRFAGRTWHLTNNIKSIGFRGVLSYPSSVLLEREVSKCHLVVEPSWLGSELQLLRDHLLLCHPWLPGFAFDHLLCFLFNLQSSHQVLSIEPLSIRILELGRFNHPPSI